MATNRIKFLNSFPAEDARARARTAPIKFQHGNSGGCTAGGDPEDDASLCVSAMARFSSLLPAQKWLARLVQLGNQLRKPVGYDNFSLEYARTAETSPVSLFLSLFLFRVVH